AIWKMGRQGAVPEEIAEIEFFASAADNEILLELYLSGEPNEVVFQKFAENLKEELPELQGISAFAGAPNRPAELLWRSGASELVYRTAHASYHVRAGSFFQTNRYLTDELV